MDSTAQATDDLARETPRGTVKVPWSGAILGAGLGVVAFLAFLALQSRLSETVSAGKLFLWIFEGTLAAALVTGIARRPFSFFFLGLTVWGALVTPWVLLGLWWFGGAVLGGNGTA